MVDRVLVAIMKQLSKEKVKINSVVLGSITDKAFGEEFMQVADSYEFLAGKACRQEVLNLT